MKVSNYIGYRNINNQGYEYEVIDKITGDGYKIRFIESGYECIRGIKEVRNGNIKDMKQPSVCGVGITGEEFEHPQKHYLYNRWRDMLRRCYDKNYKGYSTYGGAGCYVDKRWHYFPNFVRDIEDKLKNIDLNSKWNMDKDIKCNEMNIYPHYYSNETVMIISNSDNVKERNNRVGNPAYNKYLKVMQFDTKGNYIKTWNSIIEAGRELSGDYNVNTSQLISCCKNKGYTYLGYCWIYEKDFIDFKTAKKSILNRMDERSNKRRDLDEER